jgi:ribonucleoside-diphosphate reductase alpha chain
LRFCGYKGQHYVLKERDSMSKQDVRHMEQGGLHQNHAHAMMPSFSVTKMSGEMVAIDYHKIEAAIARIANEYGIAIDIELMVREVVKNIYDGVSTRDLERAFIMAAVSFIEKDPAYDRLSTGFFLQKIYREVIGKIPAASTLAAAYKTGFIEGIRKGVAIGKLDSRMLEFPLEQLADVLVIERDRFFRYTGMQTLYERYFLKSEKKVYELPQAFWMRIAMGLSLVEKDPVGTAIKFYNLFSTFRYVPSTPTLFHAGTVHPQLSSCYLNYVSDELDHIFKCYKDNANLSKWSGGIGTDWTALRATGSMIKTIDVTSQGLIPFLKITNDVTACINRSGSRRAATAVYLEVWHLDYEDYLDLRKNTGDERRRAHDINTVSWIPDLFMKRVEHEGSWTMFSPDETADLHELYGRKFEEAYEAYERKALNGEIKNFKVLQATQLWRKMLSRIFETGHPWMTFKDACNVRSPQDHVGVIHNSNLCTEITLNNSKEETAVCNIGSMNLSRHVENGVLNEAMLVETIGLAIQALDNTVENCFYPTPETKTSNMRHRPVGLGIMGLQDALFKINKTFDSAEGAEFIDRLMETISYHAIRSSALLAKERGAYSSFKGSKWDRGLFPIDTIALLEQERGEAIDVNRTSYLDWTPVRELVKTYGLRNSNLMANAPTATISTITGCFPTIEPIYKNIYVKSNMSGEFTIVNEYLVNDLKALGLWNQDMLDQIKYYDGSIQMIESIPAELRHKYREAFEIEPEVMLRLTALRSKWIDQSQSHNIFMKGVSGKRLHEVYMAAWKMGLKTTYYLRTLGASQIEKSTLDAGKFGFTQKRSYEKLESNAPVPIQPAAKAACGIDGNIEDCESCQ